MRPETVAAVFDAALDITEVALASFSQTVQRTIAENTAEGFRISTFVAGEIFTFLILEKIIMRHRNTFQSGNNMV